MITRKRLILAVLTAIFAAGLAAPVLRAQGRDSFSHSTRAHIKNCNSCHAMPTGNWVGARGYPDVAAFPGHYACFTCHKAEMFRPSAQYCAGCHTSWTNPRSAPRYAFPVRSRSNDFSTVFPHNAHQDIIASNTRKADVAVGHFVKASFMMPMATPTPAPASAPQFNNCAICHATPEKLPKFGPRPVRDFAPLTAAVADVFIPGEEIAAKFFKNSPTNHASCFTCHYQGVKPVASDCAGCHDRTRPYMDSNAVKRYSLRFDHLSASHVDKDCATCHVRITQNADVRLMKDADVPIVTCGGACHGGAPNDAPRTEKAFLTSAIANEIAAREDSVAAKQTIFQCNYCHTSAIGRLAVPPSHRLR